MLRNIPRSPSNPETAGSQPSVREKVNHFKDWVQRQPKQEGFSTLKERFQRLTQFEQSPTVRGLVRTKNLITTLGNQLKESLTTQPDLPPESSNSIESDPNPIPSYPEQVTRKARLYEKLGTGESFVQYGHAKAQLRQELFDLLTLQDAIEPQDIGRLRYVYRDFLSQSGDNEVDYIATTVGRLKETKSFLDSTRNLPKADLVKLLFPNLDLDPEELATITVETDSPLALNLKVSDRGVLNRMDANKDLLSDQELSREKFSGFARPDVPLTVEYDHPSVQSVDTHEHELFHKEVTLGSGQTYQTARKSFELQTRLNSLDFAGRSKLFTELLHEASEQISEEVLAFNIEQDHQFDTNSALFYLQAYGNIPALLTQLQNTSDSPEQAQHYQDLYTRSLDIIQQGVEATRVLREKGYSREWIATSLNTNHQVITKRPLSISQWLPLALATPTNAEPSTTHDLESKSRDYLLAYEQTDLPQSAQEMAASFGLSTVASLNMSMGYQLLRHHLDTLELPDLPKQVLLDKISNQESFAQAQQKALNQSVNKELSRKITLATTLNDPNAIIGRWHQSVYEFIQTELKTVPLEEIVKNNELHPKLEEFIDNLQFPTTSEAA